MKNGGGCETKNGASCGAQPDVVSVILCCFPVITSRRLSTLSCAARTYANYSSKYVQRHAERANGRAEAGKGPRREHRVSHEGANDVG